ncbi:hypothetical protein GQ457_09G021070 [Hibiscus cannabinus]
MISRTHELTNKLISKAPRSNRQATKRTPSLSVNRRKRTKHKSEKNHNFDFFLKRFVWIFNLNEELIKISTNSTRINKRAKFGNSFPKTSENRTTQFPGQGKTAQRGQGYRRLGFDSNVVLIARSNISYHGDVLDAYIPSKRSKGGQRFGFVRYASMEDAMRAQESLDGFPLYSYRIRVHLARFEPGRNHGRSRELWRIKNIESERGELRSGNEGEGEQSPRTDVAHLEATAVLSGKVLCQDEGVTSVTLNESERQLDLEGCLADLVAREKMADFAREDSEDTSAIIKDSESIPLVKVATSLDRLDLSSNGKESTHPTEALLVNNMIFGEVSPPIILVTVDRAKDSQNINTVNFQEQNNVGIAMEVRTVDENSDFDSFPVEEDVRSLELGKHVAWADKVDRANSINSASVLFPEMQDFHRRISKKYASMLVLQDKAISAKEKKRRDRAIKRNKRSGKENVADWQVKMVPRDCNSGTDLLTKSGIARSQQMVNLLTPVDSSVLVDASFPRRSSVSTDPSSVQGYGFLFRLRIVFVIEIELLDMLLDLVVMPVRLRVKDLCYMKSGKPALVFDRLRHVPGYNSSNLIYFRYWLCDYSDSSSVLLYDGSVNSASSYLYYVMFVGLVLSIRSLVNHAQSIRCVPLSSAIL